MLGGGAGIASAEAPCGSFAIAAESLDLAPPDGFTEICGQDAMLCEKLTQGYPPGERPIGYFVLAEEWKRFKEAPIAFSRYLVAQRARSMSPAGLPELKSNIRYRQGAIPDVTKLPGVSGSQGSVPIGVFEESADSIAYGYVMKVRTKPPLPDEDVTIASTIAALAVKDKVLILYSYWDVGGAGDAEPVKQLTRAWLMCLRAANVVGESR